MKTKMGLDDFFVRHGKKAKDKFLKLPRKPIHDNFNDSISEIVSAASLIDAPSKPIEMLINNLFATSNVAAIVAQGGTSKSMLSYQMALAISTKVNFLNIAKFSIPKSGRVLCISGEDDLQITQIRIKEIINLSRLDAEQKKLLKENLFFHYVGGTNTKLTEIRERNCVATGYDNEIIKQANKLKNCRLIVLDPVVSFRGGDENSSADNQKFMEVCRRITEKTNAAVLLVHHANKNSSQSGNHDQNAARGSSAFTDGLRAQINMSRMAKKECNEFGLHEDDAINYVKFALTKANYTKPTGDVWLKRNDKGVLHYAGLIKKDEIADIEILAKVKAVIKSELEKGREHSKSAFNDKFSGKDNLFGCGKDKLKRIVSAAIKNKEIKLSLPTTSKRNVKEVLQIEENNNVVSLPVSKKFQADYDHEK